MSLVAPVQEEIPGLAGIALEEPEARGEEHGLSLVRFMADVRTVVNALLLGAGLEGARFQRLVIDYGVEDGLPWARAALVAGGILFYLYAKPHVDVLDVDVAVDEAGEVGEKLGAAEVVPLVAAYSYTEDAERYAAGIEVETIHLGL